MPLRLALVVLALVASPARAAPGDVACVGVQRPDCTLEPATLTDALAAEASVVHLGYGPHVGNFASGATVEIAGSAGTVLKPLDPEQPTIALTGPDVTLHNARIEGRTEIAAATVRLADLDLAGVTLTGAETTARHLTVMGVMTIDGGSASVVSSALRRPDPFTVTGAGELRTRHSAHADDADADASGRVEPPADIRRPAGTVLVDGGDPAPLEPYEPFEDATGAPRVTDGDGDGVLRRDIGAYEVQPPPHALSPSSVLVNGGAEDGLAGWAGTFAAAAYGDPFLPSAQSGLAFAGGERFFSAAQAPVADLFQRIDVAAAAASIDRGLGRAALTGLLGGYGADADAVAVRAVFKDPEGRALGRLDLTPVTPAERANATTLLRRAAAGAIPPRTRAIDVLMHAERRAGTYTDAYADNLGLELSVPGIPVDPPVDPGDAPVDDLEPFHGVVVVTARPRLDARGGARFTLACADATVGACRGTLDLRAGRSRLGPIVGFAVRPGLTREVRMRLWRRRAGPATLVATAYDGQGLRRRATVPVRIRPPARPRRPGRGSAGTAAGRARRTVAR